MSVAQKKTSNSVFVPKIGSCYFVALSWFGCVKRFPTAFPSKKTQYVEGEVLSINKNEACVQFPALLELIKIKMSGFLKNVFLANIPPGCSVFSSSAFCTCFPEEYHERSKSAFLQLSKLKACGTEIVYADETIDMYENSSRATRVKRLQECLIEKITETKSGNAALERKRSEVEEWLRLKTPLFNPSGSFVMLWVHLWKRVYCSLRFWNVSCDRVVDIYASKDLVEKAGATFLELCGWDVTENAGGTFQFQTHSLKIVQASFASSDMMPDLVDPLFRITFIKSDSVFEMQKKAVGYYLKVACNPRDPSIEKKELLKMARNELGAENFPEATFFSKPIVAKKIIDHRMKNKHWVGFKSLNKVVVSQQHPCCLQFKTVAYGRTRIRVQFHTQNFSFLVSNKKGMQCRIVQT